MTTGRLGMILAVCVAFQTPNVHASDSIDFAEAQKVMGKYRQWMIGANTTGLLYPKSAWTGPTSSNYNMKGSVIKKFLQYEKQGAGGINLGWTDNASASTAKKRAKWFFARKSNSKKPIVYGEPIAMGWGKAPSFFKYSHRTVGINLDWTKKPSYEWAILGGKPGTPVKKGKDWVVIYNLKHKQPLMYFDRTVGGDIGWPDSKTWKRQTLDRLDKYVTMENAVKALIYAAAL